MIRVVADTNILASGLAGYATSSSPESQILRAWRQGRLDLVTSAAILVELERTLAKPYFAQRLSPGDADRALELLRRRSQFVHDLAPVHGVATTPEDDLILATAVSGEASHLVTGDRQLLKVGGFRGIEILRAREFLGRL